MEAVLGTSSTGVFDLQRCLEWHTDPSKGLLWPFSGWSDPSEDHLWTMITSSRSLLPLLGSHSAEIERMRTFSGRKSTKNPYLNPVQSTKIVFWATLKFVSDSFPGETAPQRPTQYWYMVSTKFGLILANISCWNEKKTLYKKLWQCLEINRPLQVLKTF